MAQLGRCPLITIVWVFAVNVCWIHYAGYNNGQGEMLFMKCIEVDFKCYFAMLHLSGETIKMALILVPPSFACVHKVGVTVNELHALCIALTVD